MNLVVSFMRALECPGPPAHDCTDRNHPVLVEVVPLNIVTDGREVTISDIPPGVERITLWVTS